MSQCQYDCSIPAPATIFDVSWLTSNETFAESLGDATPLHDLVNFLWQDVLKPALLLLNFMPFSFSSGSPQMSCINHIIINDKIDVSVGSITVKSIDGLICNAQITSGQFQTWPGPDPNTTQLWFVLILNTSLAMPINYDLPLYNSTDTLKPKMQITARCVIDLQCGPSGTLILQNIRLVAAAFTHLDYDLPAMINFYKNLAQAFGFISKDTIKNAIIDQLPMLINLVNDQIKNTGLYPMDLKIPCSILSNMIPYCFGNTCVFQYGGMSLSNPIGEAPCGESSCIGRCYIAGGACCIACSAALSSSNHMCKYNADIFTCGNMAGTASNNPKGNKSNTALFIQLPTPNTEIIDCGHSQCSFDDGVSCSGCAVANTSCNPQLPVNSYCILNPALVPPSLDGDNVGPAVPGGIAHFIQARPQSSIMERPFW